MYLSIDFLSKGIKQHHGNASSDFRFPRLLNSLLMICEDAY